MRKVIFATLAICLIIGCMDAKKDSNDKKENKNTDKKEEVPFDSIFVTDVDFEKNIQKKLNANFQNKTIFNDGSTFKIIKPLTIGKPQDISKTFFISDNFEYTLNKTILDSAGVAMKGKTYHPTLIGKIALKAIKDYKKTNSAKSKKVFFDQLRWIENNFHETENYGFWFFPFDFPHYNLQSGWTSVYSQGLMINVCLEAYKLTGKTKYASMIEKALKAYLVPVEFGGFMRKWNEQELWFEEYPTKKPSRVLNGFMYGLVGVYNVYQDLDLDLAKKIFDSGISTLQNHIQDWNLTYSSLYNAGIDAKITKENYHEGHVIQLLWLYRVTGEEIFKEYAKIFLESDRSNFMSKTDYKLPNKIKKVIANHTIDTIGHGVEHLNDQLWSYGKFWSSYKKTDLIINFGEKKNNIHGLTLYHVSKQSKDVNFTIYAFDEEEKEWKYVEQFIPKISKAKISVYHETGGFETYIEHHPIVEPLNARKVKIVFEATNENIIALREINFIFDRTEDINHLIDVVDKTMNIGN